ncbi:MAG: GTP-binding protein Era [Gammaproteobacteria bacterium]|jgi:GTP-binding protein Era
MKKPTMDTTEKKDDFRCGYATIIGRPNVGKSTLLNILLGQKLSITSRKPQTTQRRLLGIKTEEKYQIIYIDTPGMQSKYKDAINLYMRREIMNSLTHIDVLVFMVESLKWTKADEDILNTIADTKLPVLLLINKIDKTKDRGKLLPFIQTLSAKRVFADVIPVSARNNINIREIENAIYAYLPEAPAEYPADQVTDKSERFIVAEFIREKLIRKLGEELPYSITVTIDKFIREEEGVTIHAIIWVESPSQKGIVIGKDGGILKSVGEQARKDMKNLLDCNVYLRTWVKVKKNWSDDKSLLKQFGFES